MWTTSLRPQNQQCPMPACPLWLLWSLWLLWWLWLLWMLWLFKLMLSISLCGCFTPSDGAFPSFIARPLNVKGHVCNREKLIIKYQMNRKFCFILNKRYSNAIILFLHMQLCKQRTQTFITPPRNRGWGYIFTVVGVCMHMCVCVCVCLSVCLSMNTIPSERIHWFGRNFR